MPVLEREGQLQALTEYAAGVHRGEGRLVLVAGEAGVGKSTLVETFAASAAGLRWVWGLCDGGFTPRPLGPLADIADQVGGTLQVAAAEHATREDLFRALLAELDTTATAVVFEDLHWADEATLDLVRYLSRRLRQTPALVVVTYREEELTPDHPLRLTLGRLGSDRGTRRLTLPRLSPAAVAELAAGSPLDPAELHRLTEGNPYFVGEVLRSAPGTLPPSARDAVLARVATLDHEDRALLQAAAVIGTRVDPGLLAAVHPASGLQLDHLVGSGLLVTEGTHLRFRHELARLAVVEATPAHRRTALHRRTLTALRDRGSPDHALLSHHAEGANDAAGVVEHAAAAARRAAQLSAHREAAQQYERAVRWTPTEDATRADLLDALSTELGALERWDDAEEVRRDALAIWRRLDDPTRHADCLRALSLVLWRQGRGAESERCIDEAVSLLEREAPGPQLARALARAAATSMVNGRNREAVARSDRALRMAHDLDLPDVLSDSLDTKACALLALGEDWEPDLLESLDVARRHGVVDQAARAFVNYHGALVGDLRLADADTVFEDAWAWCEEHDVPVWGNCLLASHAEALTLGGRWDEAAALARGLLGTALSPVNRMHLQLPLLLIELRRGGPDAAALLASTWQAAVLLDEPQWLVPIGLARVEAHWIAAEDDQAREILTQVATHLGDVPRASRGFVAVWQHRLGAPVTVTDLTEPFASHVHADAACAADHWVRIGCDYQAALALLDGTADTEWRRGLDLLDRLGAEAVSTSVRRRLRRAGVRGLARRRRRDTLAHPAGLTGREQEVLELIAENRTNDEIAEQLVISPKTVDHHVSAVLTKLGVPNRREAAALARRQDLGRAQVTDGELLPMPGPPGAP